MFSFLIGDIPPVLTPGTVRGPPLYVSVCFIISFNWSFLIYLESCRVTWFGNFSLNFITGSVGFDCDSVQSGDEFLGLDNELILFRSDLGGDVIVLFFVTWFWGDFLAIGGVFLILILFGGEGLTVLVGIGFDGGVCGRDGCDSGLGGTLFVGLY